MEPSWESQLPVHMAPRGEDSRLRYGENSLESHGEGQDRGGGRKEQDSVHTFHGGWGFSTCTHI